MKKTMVITAFCIPVFMLLCAVKVMRNHYRPTV
jgi:hypothetical protein